MKSFFSFSIKKGINLHEDELATFLTYYIIDFKNKRQKHKQDIVFGNINELNFIVVYSVG